MSADSGQAFMSWAGLSTPASLDADNLATFNRFYDEVHIPEILAHNPGFLSAQRYRLVSCDPLGQTGPGWLTVYQIEDEAAARVAVAVASPRRLPCRFRG